MPLFEYTEERGPGDIRTSTMEAVDKEQAIKKLMNSGTKLLRIDELTYTQEMIHKRLERLRRMRNYLEGKGLL